MKTNRIIFNIEILSIVQRLNQIDTGPIVFTIALRLLWLAENVPFCFLLWATINNCGGLYSVPLNNKKHLITLSLVNFARILLCNWGVLSQIHLRVNNSVCTTVSPRDQHNPVWLSSVSLCLSVSQWERLSSQVHSWFSSPRTQNPCLAGFQGGDWIVSMACWCLGIIVLVLGLIVLHCAVMAL